MFIAEKPKPLQKYNEILSPRCPRHECCTDHSSVPRRACLGAHRDPQHRGPLTHEQRTISFLVHFHLVHACGSCSSTPNSALFYFSICSVCLLAYGNLRSILLQFRTGQEYCNLCSCWEDGREKRGRVGLESGTKKAGRLNKGGPKVTNVSLQGKAKKARGPGQAR